MAKTCFGEYITFAVILRRFGSYFAPQRALARKGMKMTMKLLVTIALLSLVVALALPPMAAADAAADYKAKCAACHGADGMGKPAMGTKDFGSADIQKMSDADLTAAITSGKGKMPAYKGKLTDAQISDLVKYIRSFKKM
jgi:mono/diheme cytochrome c family protein